MRNKPAVVSTLIAGPVAVLMPAAAFAYVGPGAGLSAVGALFALIAAVVLAIVGFVWYPLKRLLQPRTGGDAPRAGNETPGRGK